MHAYRPLAALSIILATVLLTTAIHTPSTTAKEPAAHTPSPLLMYRDIPWVTMGGKTLEQIEAQGQNALKAAVLSYGVFDLEQRVRDGLESPGNGFWKMGGAKARGIFGKDISIDTHPALYRAVSPIQRVPTTEERRLPPTFVHVGSKDTTTPPSAVKRFADQLAIAGQTVVFKEYADKNHAFLDSGCNEYLGNCFDEDAPDTLKDMIDFLKRHFE
ncbi:alpha/beta hydrolase family protein [Microbulbifer elongatus]|uniref:alpha/beta hydrolase family protein n=1 Tax=Microbulbifer elongatus TaxID=86173 RepID=UPI001E4EB1BD|nr:prolyl oligopeptidase family serine peptidase [Microbulbifer elongatus]